MDYSDIINVLSNRYNELQKEFQSVQDLVNDIDFVFDFTEEEQWLFYRMRSTMEEHCGALLRLIRFLKKQAREESDDMFQTQHDPNFDDVDPEQKAKALHHCGQDAVNFEQLSDNLTDTYKDYCRGVLEQFLSREITWAKFVEKVALPFCHENVNEFVNAIKEGRSDCGQDADMDDACCQVREKDSPQGEFQNIHIHKGNVQSEQQGCIRNLSLAGMQVIGIGDRRCEGCRQDDRYGATCVKLELVGGDYICLAPLHNSIVTE